MKESTLMLHTKLSNQNTSHVLHLLLSVITAGVWIPVWLLVALSNSMERTRLIKKIEKIEGGD